jgi:hypothetical protein
MKNITLFLLLIILYSCSSKEDKILKKHREQIINVTKNELRKPETFKLIEFKYTDTFKRNITYTFSAENSKGYTINKTIYHSLNPKGEIFYSSTKGYDVEYGTLNGKVHLQELNYLIPLRYANVKLVNIDTLNTGSNYETTTDENGDFKLNEVIPGKYIISIINKNKSLFDVEESDYLVKKIYLLSMFQSLISLNPNTLRKRYNVSNDSSLLKKYKILENSREEIQKTEDELIILLLYTEFKRIFPEFISMLPFQLIQDLDLLSIENSSSIIQTVEIDSKIASNVEYRIHY